LPIVQAERASRKVSKTISRKIAPAPIVKHVLAAIEKEARAEAAEVVKGALKKAAARILQEASTG